MNCHEVAPLLTPYVDGELPPAERAPIVDHLARCEPCAARAASEQAARRLVRLRARLLAVPAPDPLRARCAALAKPSRAPGRPRWFAWHHLGLATATGVLVALTGLVGYAAASHSPTMLVAGLTLDHLKCFAFSSNDPRPADAHALEAGLERDYGWRLAVPAGASRERLTLVGARRCFSTDGSIAHVLYRHAGRPVSLFVLPDRVHRAAAMSIAGHPARIWSQGGRTFVLVGSETDAGLQPVARYFLSAAY